MALSSALTVLGMLQPQAIGFTKSLSSLSLGIYATELNQHYLISSENSDKVWKGVWKILTNSETYLDPLLCNQNSHYESTGNFLQ